MVGGPEIIDDGWLFVREHVGGDGPRVKWPEDIGDFQAVAAEADDADGGVMEVASGAADEFVLLLCSKEHRQAAEQA